MFQPYLVDVHASFWLSLFPFLFSVLILKFTDSYVVVELRGSDNDVLAQVRTKERHFSNNPVYKEVFSFELPSRPIEDWDFTNIQHPLDNVSLTITVHRRKLFFEDDAIGCVTLRSEVRTNGYSHLWKCKRSPYQPITEWHDLKSVSKSIIWYRLKLISSILAESLPFWDQTSSRPMEFMYIYSKNIVHNYVT